MTCNTRQDDMATSCLVWSCLVCAARGPVKCAREGMAVGLEGVGYVRYRVPDWRRPIPLHSTLLWTIVHGHGRRVWCGVGLTNDLIRGCLIRGHERMPHKWMPHQRMPHKRITKLLSKAPPAMTWYMYHSNSRAAAEPQSRETITQTTDSITSHKAERASPLHVITTSRHHHLTSLPLRRRNAPIRVP